MTSILGRLVSTDDEDFPGWARVRVDRADGTAVEVHDKQPVIGLGAEVPGDSVCLDCEVLEIDTGGSVTVRLLHGMATTDGHEILTVQRARLLEAGTQARS